MNFFATYWHALRGHRRQGGVFLGLLLLSGGLEGLAIASIIPLLSAGGPLDSGDELVISALGLRVSGSAAQAVALGVFVGLGTLSALGRFASERQALRLVADMERGMRMSATRALLRMRWSSFITLRMGEISSSMLMTAAQVTSGALFFLRGVGTLAVAGIFGAMALIIAFELSLFTFAFAALAGIGYRISGKRAERRATELAATTGEIGNEVSDIFGNLKFFRSTGNVERSEQRMTGVYNRFADAYYRSQIVGPFMRLAFESGALLFVGLILATSLVADGHLTARSIAFLGLFYRLAPRFVTAQEYLQSARVQRPWFHSWNDQLQKATSAQEPPASGLRPSFDDRLAAIDVGFRFPGAPRPALDEVSWHLARGECIAFVGSSGGGKTTMLDIVTGLLAPTSGRIETDGVGLGSVDIAEWQTHIGLVSQESPVFHATVLQNVAWLKGDLDEERARQSLAQANALDFVDQMPDGLHSVVGERGGRLSGGQRQRLALARALYRRPWLLVLDEPTSALDGQSEAVIQEALGHIKGQCSMIIVAHRLKTVGLADRIYVLEEGRIVESGSWRKLVSNPQSALSAMAREQRLDIE